MTEVPIIDIETAAELARTGDLDAAIATTRRAVRDLLDNGFALYLGTATTELVTALLQRGGSDDAAEARAAVDRLAAATPDPASVLHELPVLRLRALLARDSARVYQNVVDHCTGGPRSASMATSGSPPPCIDQHVASRSTKWRISLALPRPNVHFGRRREGASS